MKVLLLKDVRKVGAKNSIVDVADGYAINHLLPNKLAAIATPDTVAKVAATNAAHEKEKEAQLARLAETLQSLKGEEITISVLATNKGGLFKSIGTPEILNALKTQKKADLPESAIRLEHPIKMVGKYPVELESNGKKVTITVSVVAGA